MTAVAHMKPIEATNRLILAALHAEPKPNEDNKYIGLCPVHETLKSNPSLLIYENSSGYLGFTCLSRKCEHNAIVGAIKSKFGLAVPYPTKSVDKSGGNINKIINYPAHESALPLKYRKPNDIIYEYHCETGEVAFIVQRWVNEDGRKDIRPFFSKTFMSDEGMSQKDWDATEPPKKDRPLYNLANLYKHKDKPVIIVEGEKTADAAMRIPELKGFIITTWSGGTSAHKYTDWKPLRERDSSIYFWPDNDASGTKAMREILAKLSTGFKDTRFFTLNYRDLGVHEVVQGWDLADESAAPENQYSIGEMLAGFVPYVTEEILETGSFEEEIAKLEADISLVNLGGDIIYVELGKPMDDPVIPYYHWNTLASLKAERNKQIIVDDKKVSTVAAWAATPSKPAYIGLDFRPDIEGSVITTPIGKQINLFTGLENFGEGTNDLLVTLFNHFMDKIVPDNAERIWLIDQIRLSIQTPAVKPGNAIVLIGRQGTGKSTFHNIWSTLLGRKNCSSLGNGLSSDFNSVMVKSLLITWDEFEINHHKQAKEYNLLKSWITEPRMFINAKNKNPFEVTSYHRFVFTSNSSKPISLPPEDRRFFIYSISDALRDNDDFFTKLYTIIDPTHTRSRAMDERDRLGALSGLFQWLKNTPITTQVNKIVSTTVKREMSTANALVIEIFRQMYNERELPHFITDFMEPQEAALFGKRLIRLPQARFLQAVEKQYGRKHADPSERSLLKRYFMELASDGENTRAMVLSYKDDHGNMISKMSKYYLLPPIAEGRARLEDAVGSKLGWDTSDVIHESDDKTNVIELAKKDSII